MKLLETSFLVDYERGREPTRTYYQAHRDEVLAASTVSLFELAFGVVLNSHGTVEDLRESLRWVDFLDFGVSDAVEAAQIQAELQGDGTRIHVGEVLIAGVARNRGATLVAADDHFDGIDGLAVETHRR